jgi:toxin FitB
MRYLVDTCVLSELTKSAPSSNVVRWLSKADESTLCISALSLGELESGVRHLRASKRASALRAWLDDLRETYGERVVPVSADVAVEWGKVVGDARKKGIALPVVDALLGATALVHDLTVVTRNVRDIGRTGARIFDPWE